MDSSSAPPVYSASDATKDNEGPPAFEPGTSAPPVLADSKLPLDQTDDGGLASLPQRARAPSGSAPTSFIPPSLRIGTHTLGPFDLVTIPEIRAHLSFLGAFARLKAQVKSQKGSDVRGSVDELWATYIARAVDRFAKWVDKVVHHQTGSDLRELAVVDVPPLDVLMAWHTYMLNPRVYFEDGARKKSKLWKIRS
ncbi:hypothetical protein BDV93DRAFT_336804 [Ceratobasidium sp. AG-I]|nr:hypothetical protein BDV93DRAFT_336804 [Ceratobasidium sp. AG-I]